MLDTSTDRLDQSLNTYFRIVFVTCVILIALYAMVLFRIFKGSKYQFLYLMTVMLLVSNIFAILTDTFQRIWLVNIERLSPYLYLQVVCAFFRDALFNLAHWIFCFKYWQIAVEMQAVLEAKPLSLSQRKKHRCINWTLICVDILSPLLYSVLYAVLNTVYD